MKRIVIFCIATPFIMFLLSCALGCFFLWITDTPNGPYRIWKDNLKEREMLPVQYEDLFIAYSVLSVSLFTCCLNINRKIRNNAPVSFVTFFWFILFTIVLVIPSALILWTLELYFPLYIVVLIAYFIWFRVKVNKGFFETKQIIENENN